MTDPATIAVVIASSALATSVWRWLAGRNFDATVDEFEARVAQVEERVKKLKTSLVKKIPSAGPFRTAPPDPNAESSLPEPMPSTETYRLYEWDKALVCPVCHAGNRFRGRDADRTINKESHTVCNGCAVTRAPHLHVTCWACKFKYAVQAASESKDGEA